MPPEAGNPTYQPLTRCRCGSTLIYPVAVHTGRPGRAIIDRRCPECELRDTVTTAADAAAVWIHHQSYLRARLQASLVAR